jgi:hypothetical protein
MNARGTGDSRGAEDGGDLTMTEELYGIGYTDLNRVFVQFRERDPLEMGLSLNTSIQRCQRDG